jgi:hypothetical protein
VWSASIVMSRAWPGPYGEDRRPYAEVKLSEQTTQGDSAGAGAQFTCFNGTDVQILTPPPSDAGAAKSNGGGRGGEGEGEVRRGGFVHTLVPGADMPNHLSAGYDAGQGPDGTIVLRANGDLQPGTQMYVSYGSKCDAEFMTTYGFIPSNNSHVPCKPLSCYQGKGNPTTCDHI